MKLYAISDLHLGFSFNRQALEALPTFKDDWLIVAGDIGETFALHHYAFALLVQKFARIIWVPGNHDLWTLPLTNELERGEEKYQKLIAICHEYDVVTPEDPYIIWPGEGESLVLAPLFVLYDYSFRPDTISQEGALAWAEETNVVCSDEILLHPDPYPSRSDWCQARCVYTEERLRKEALLQTVIINHFPLRQTLVRLPRIPRFSLWCGTRRTENWHTLFSARVVVYGHVHMRATDYQDNVRFEEVSLGYPQQWQKDRNMQTYLREILPGPAYSQENPPLSTGPFWHW